ncbi:MULTISPECIES: hypothetical protein [unclassified Chitinophaga]|uniref:hypothetical protein n=1 Tax=unclassified Chitinophaga TaxID=2619133 RepID=UPI0030103C6A
MKKAKIILTVIVVLGTIGGSLAFKASRTYNIFYSFGTTIRAGEELQGCVLSIALRLTAVPVGGFITTLYSSAFTEQTNTCTARVTTSM